MVSLTSEERCRSEFDKERQIWPYQLHSRSQLQRTGRRLHSAEVELHERGWNRGIISKMIQQKNFTH